MSDNDLEDYLMSVVNVDKFNESMKDLKLLNEDMLKLGFNVEYINNLNYSFVNDNLISEYGVLSTERFLFYRNNYMSHIFSIIKIKHPSKYYDLLDKYDWKE